MVVAHRPAGVDVSGPKRIPGERNPQPDTDALIHVVDHHGGMGSNGRDYGIARGIIALLDWRRRPKGPQASLADHKWVRVRGNPR